jgi:hypothetical protein
MRLRMWMYDLAREQSPTIDHLRRLFDLTRESGYNAIGLYLEHRFAYPSTPWAHGSGAITRETVETLLREYPEIQIVPFVNLLGHFEGMLYTEQGSQYAEEQFKGMQACPSNPRFLELANRILDDTIAIFPSDLIHIGGDETTQLGKCPICRQRVLELESADPSTDGKAVLYGDHFAPLAKKVVDAGRIPAVWGDMFLEHPQALDRLPKQTTVFDWQYFQSPSPSSRQFRSKGFNVVCCPTLHVYDSAWLHMAPSEQNVRDCVAAVQECDAEGVCLATWEGGLFANYETLLPAIQACGKLFSQDQVQAPSSPAATMTVTAERTELMPNEVAVAAYGRLHEAPALLKEYLQSGETYEEWARLMGLELNALGGVFGFTGLRNGLKCRLLLYSNPFLAWLHHHDELCGAKGDAALDIVERAIAVSPNASARGVSQFVKSGVQFVRFAELARLAYAAGKPGEAITHLSPCRQVFDDLAAVARATNIRIGGSLADIERCKIAKEHVERVIRRVKEYGDGSLGYLPSFAMLTHPKFVPHDQAGWWLMNDWANE